MSIYFIVKPIIMLILLGGAAYIFGKRISLLLRIMKKVKGKTTTPIEAIKQRIGYIFTDVIWQRNVRRKCPAGHAHMLIFLGFVVLGPHSLEMLIEGFFRHFSWGLLSEPLYGIYLFTADFFALGVFLGVSYGLIRRTILKPKYLTNGPSAIFILSLICLIVLSFFGANVVRIALATNLNTVNYASYEPISTFIFNLLPLSNISIDNLYWLYEVVFFAHVLPILYFLTYIPTSKHLHLITAAPNVFLKPLQREKAILKTNLEDENSTSFGLGKTSDLHWKNVLDLYACTECGRCEEQCPASRTGKQLSPKRFIKDLKENLLSEANNILTDGEAKAPYVRPDSPITDEVIWSCTTCRACENICPVNIQHMDLMLETRKNLVLMEARFPAELQVTLQNLENQSNPWGLGQDTRADWLKGLNAPIAADKPNADILYFAGCFGCFNENGIKIAQSIVKLLQKANINFAVLGGEETCCGDPARRAGNEYLAQMQITQLAETLNNYSPKKILTGCPHCFNVLKNEYPDFGAKFEVVHHSQFLAEILASQQLKTITNSTPQSVTFHDSCYLTRWNSISNAPRQVLSNVPGCSIIEMPQKEDLCFCCGAGGSGMFLEENTGERINHVRVAEAIATQASTLATACPYCNTMLADGIKAKDSPMPVRDIAEILLANV